MRPVKIISRESTLALAQTLNVAQAFSKKWDIPFEQFQIIPHKTIGDKQLDIPLYEVISKEERNNTENTKSLFTTELEHYLIDEKADFAVHSLKDMPTELPENFQLWDVHLQKSSADCFIIKKSSLKKFEKGQKAAPIKVACSSLRRKALLNFYMPHIEQVNLRGNIITRFNKLMEDENLDGMLLAVAGIQRLKEFYQSWENGKLPIIKNISLEIKRKLEIDLIKASKIDFNQLIFLSLSKKKFPPAVSQGILGIETKKNSEFEKNFNRKFNDISFKKKEIIKWQRGLLKKIEAGCHAPFGVHVYREKIANKKLFAVNFFFDYLYNDKNLSKPHFYLRYFSKLDSDANQLIANEILSTKNNQRKKIIYTGTAFNSFEKKFKEQIQILDEIYPNLKIKEYAQKNFELLYIPLIEVEENQKYKNVFLKKDYSIIFFSSKNSFSFLKEIPNANQYIFTGNSSADDFLKKIQILNKSYSIENIRNKIVILDSKKNKSKAKLAIEFIKKNENQFDKTKTILWVGSKQGIKKNISNNKKIEIEFLEPYKTKSIKYSHTQFKKFDFHDNLNAPNYWVFTSPSCVKSYFKNDFFNSSNIHCSIGQTTAKKLLKKNLTSHLIPDQTSMEELIKLILGVNEKKLLKMKEKNFKLEKVIIKLKNNL